MDDLAFALRLDSAESCRDRWGLRRGESGMWTPTAKADWTDCGVQTSKGPPANWPHFVTSSERHSKNNPACTIAEACDRIEKLTGIRRSPTRVRRFLKDMGLKWQHIRAIPVPHQKTRTSTFRDQAEFLNTKLKPQLDDAQAGQGNVFFVDADHFVFGTFLCCLRSTPPDPQRLSSRRPRGTSGLSTKYAEGLTVVPGIAGQVVELLLKLETQAK